MAGTRSAILSNRWAGESSVAYVRCYADRTVRAFDQEELAAEEAPADLDARLEAAERSCGRLA